MDQVQELDKEGVCVAVCVGLRVNAKLEKVTKEA